MHSAVHRSIARVFASFTNKNREKMVLVFGLRNIHVASSRFGSFVRFVSVKKSIARNHRTVDFNLVPKFLSYPSLRSERERENG